jgi:hypothetical protein
MAGSGKKKPPATPRRLAGLAVVLIALALVSAAWRQANQPPPARQPQAATSMALQQPTPTATISSEDIEVAPEQTTGIIIVTGVVVLIIIYGTVSASRRRNEW